MLNNWPLKICGRFVTNVFNYTNFGVKLTQKNNLLNAYYIKALVLDEWDKYLDAITLSPG
jgi:hypothetical protein